jgi:DNA-binding MarR family transcriptional regulator
MRKSFHADSAGRSARRSGIAEPQSVARSVRDRGANGGCATGPRNPLRLSGFWLSHLWQLRVGGVLDLPQLPAYTCSMAATNTKPASASCLSLALRQASRAVSRVYDEELRRIGLRTTQFSVLRVLSANGELRQRDLAELTVHEETTLTRNLRPLLLAGWVTERPGHDRREKWLKITSSGVAQLKAAHPLWKRAQQRMRSSLSEEVWQNLLVVLPEVARQAAEA